MSARTLLLRRQSILYTTDDPEILLSHFKDDATAFNAQKRQYRWWEINCTISTALFQYLRRCGIPTHFIDCPSPNQMRVRVANFASRSCCQEHCGRESLSTNGCLWHRSETAAGGVLLQNDQLGDPLLTRDRLLLLEPATPEQVEQIQQAALQINHLSDFFHSCGITLVDFKLGLDSEAQLRLADEISPDTPSLEPVDTDPNRRVMDKDRFRRDLWKRLSASFRASSRKRQLSAVRLKLMYFES